MGTQTLRLSVLSLVLLSLAACRDDTTPPPPVPGGALSEELTPTPEVWLYAQAFQIPAFAFGNPQPILMWGFGRCRDGFSDCTLPSVPGPRLVAAENVPLTVHLLNRFDGQRAEPVSFVVPGQIQTMTPVWFDPASGVVTSTGSRAPGDVTSRVRSFTTETPPQAVVTYVVNAPRAGTYLYQSGTHPAVQVQMGLYGALTVVPAAPNRAYADDSTVFANETVLLFSEIDSSLHAAVAAGRYGPNPNAPAPPPPGQVTSTIGYHPDHFLINGSPWTPAMDALRVGAPGETVLLRLLNAGLETKVAQLDGPYLSLIAEDGNLTTVTMPGGAVVPAPREQYSALLPAGKTVDALFRPTSVGTYALYDRRLNLTNAGDGPGGQLVFLSVARPPAPGLVLAPRVLNFSADVGDNHTRNVLVRNLGTTARTLNEVLVTPLGFTAEGSFELLTVAPVTVPAGGSVHLRLRFTPVNGRRSTAAVLLITDDPQSPTLSVSLTGTVR